MRLNFTLFDGSKRPKGRRVTTTWAGLVKGLSEHRQRPTKDGKGWAPFTFASDLRRKEGLEVSSVLVLDVDSTTTPNWAALEGVEYVGHTTYSGKWRVVILLERAVTGPEYNALARFTAHALDTEGWTDHRIDEGWFQPSRFYFTPSCPPGQHGMVVRGRGVPLPVTPAVPVDVSGRITPSTRPVERPSTPPPVQGLDLDYLRARARTPEVTRFLAGALALKEGARDNTITKVAGFMASAPVNPTPWEVWAPLVDATLAQSTLPEGEKMWRDTWKEKFSRFYAQRVRDGELARAVKAGLSVAPGEDDWKAKLSKVEKKDGTTAIDPKDPRNLTIILQNDPAFASVRRNDLTMSVEYGRECPLYGYALETTPSVLQDWLVENYKLHVSLQTCQAKLFAFTESRRYDPLKDYFDKLPEWDGKSRIETLLPRATGCEGHPIYIAAVSRCFFLAAAARATRPGCQVDTMLVLQGAPSLRKSTFARSLSPGFSASSDIDLSRDGLLLLARNWVVEFAEMVAPEAKLERVRGFLTRPFDTFRAPYAREVRDYPRHCVFIGTTNEYCPIKDETGARRYWPVTVTKKIDIDLLVAEREQLWAEAKYRIDAGEQWWFTDEEEEIFVEEVKDYVDTDSIQEAIDRAIRATRAERRKKEYTFMDILDLIGVDPMKLGQSERTRIGMALHRLKFVRVTKDLDGRAVRCYLTPPSIMHATATATGPQAYSGPQLKAQA